MRVLALDTATPDLVTGVVDSVSGQNHEQAIEDTRLLSEQLMPTIETVIGQQANGYADIDAIAVGIGPGPFTGLRVGMATASALGQALGIPVHGVCTHDAIAQEIAAHNTASTLLVATDARRKEIYYCVYRIEDGTAVRLGDPNVVSPESLNSEDLQLDAAPELISIPAHLVERLPENLRAGKIINQRPTAAGLVGVAELESTPEPLVPLYLRRPDAKEPAAKPRSAAIPEVEL